MFQNECDLFASMKFVADLHLHSKYSRAVSAQMLLANMANWAIYKGISVAATGDFTHPFWFDDIKNDLEDAGNGLYRLKTNDQRLTQKDQALDVSPSALDEKKVYFLLSCEVSSIYSQGGRSRRIHTLFFFPSLNSVAKFNAELLKRGANLRSDGRSIVGIPARDLCEIALRCDTKALIIPAHIWTPWYSVFGAFSGFDSIKECFGDLAQNIYGVETGLSSDPVMNWGISDLDTRAILSFSDAHSLAKMGREATVIEADEISYDSIYDAIYSSGNKKPKNMRSKIAFTIEFYPQEGKYHYTGHRDCNVSYSPAELARKGRNCPVCARQLTIGVTQRVKDLQDNESGFEFRNINGVRWVYANDNNRPPYVSMVPLAEIISEVEQVGVSTKNVTDKYFVLVKAFGSEFNVLLKADIAEIAKNTNQKIADAIAKVRSGDIVVEPGYDGKFGVVKIDETEDRKNDSTTKSNSQESQLKLFAR